MTDENIELLYKLSKNIIGYHHRDLDISFDVKTEWEFDDGYIFDGTNTRVLILKHKDKPIAVMGFKTFGDTIYVQFIQGVKGEKPIKNWPDLLMERLLLGILKSKLNLNVYLSVLQYHKDLVKVLKEHNNLKTTEDIRNFENQNYTFKHINNLLSFYNKIRDRWFDKRGFLNKSRKRVKEVINMHKTQYKPFEKHVK